MSANSMEMYPIERKPRTGDGEFVCGRLLGLMCLQHIRMGDILVPLTGQLYRITTSPIELAIELVALQVITSNEQDKCESKATPKDKIVYLYGIIFQKNYVPKFILALEESGNQHVIEAIKDFLNQRFPETDDVHNEGGEVNSPSESSISLLDQPDGGPSPPQTELSRPDITVNIGESSETSLPEKTSIQAVISICFIIAACGAIGITLYAKLPFSKSNNDPPILMPSISRDVTPHNPHVTYFGKEFPFTLDSPLTQLPPNQSVINLTIEPEMKYDWCGWSAKNPECVRTVNLKGKLDAQDIICIIQKLPLLINVNFFGDYLCDELRDDQDASWENVIDTLKTVHLKYVQSLSISSISRQCPNLYKLLAEKMRFGLLKDLTVNNVTIGNENEGYFHDILREYQPKLQKLFLRDVILLGSMKSTLFYSLDFPYLTEAIFNVGPNSVLGSPRAVDSLKNLNYCTSNLQAIHSNVLCSYAEWLEYNERWKSVDEEDSSNQICDK